MVVVSVSDTNITTAGEVQLMIDVHAPPGDEVVFPDIAPLIEPFSVADSYQEPMRMLPNGKHLHRRVWTLIPSLPGYAHFQEMEMTVGSARIATDPLTISVDSLLPEGLDSLEIRDISEPVDLLPEQTAKRRLRSILLAAGLIAGLLTGGLYMAKHRKEKPPVPPYEAALASMAALPDDTLARIRALTQLLLVFIERRYQLPLSAKTLREILAQLKMERLLENDARLEPMLTASEHIRFSNRIPAGFADELEAFVRSFVEERKEEPCG